MRKNLGITDD
jgi:fatty acyl-CoA reductase